VTLLRQLDSTLMQRALIEALLVGALCGAVGAHVLVRRLPFFALALSHATLPGVVLASMLGISLYVGGGMAALALVVAVTAIGATRRLDASTATGVALAGAFAIGVLLQSARTGASKDLAAFLVGDVLTVRNGDIAVTVAIALVVIGALGALHKPLVFAAFDREGATAAGYRVTRLDAAVLAIVALTVVTSIHAVGTILVVALLVTPALAARQWVGNVAGLMAGGAAVGAVAAFAGMAASAQWDVAGGASIALSATALLVLSALVRLSRGRAAG
jgi:manganese/iron transport system permease protein